jgi:hypothetical protein
MANVGRSYDVGRRAEHVHHCLEWQCCHPEKRSALERASGTSDQIMILSKDVIIIVHSFSGLAHAAWVLCRHEIEGEVGRSSYRSLAKY